MWCTSCEAPYTFTLHYCCLALTGRSGLHIGEGLVQLGDTCSYLTELLLEVPFCTGQWGTHALHMHHTLHPTTHKRNNYKYNYNCYTLRSRRDTMLQFQLNLLAQRWSHNYRVGCVQSGTISCHTPIEAGTASTSSRTYGYNKMAVDSG